MPLTREEIERLVLDELSGAENSDEAHRLAAQARLNDEAEAERLLAHARERRGNR